jgi:hypothetical protein
MTDEAIVKRNIFTHHATHTNPQRLALMVRKV